MQIRRSAAIAILILVFLVSAVVAFFTRPSVTAGSGNLRAEERVVTDVRQVVLDNSGELTIIVGDEETLTIESDDNILPLLQADVNGDTLTLTVQGGNSISPTALNYTLTVPTLTNITTRGSGNITGSITAGENLEVVVNGSGNVQLEAVMVSDLFEFTTNGSGSVQVAALTAAKSFGTANGSGDITLEGQVLEQELYLNGSGDYDGDGLVSATGIVEVDGSGSANVNVTERLTATISGSGSINYFGEPEVEANINGDGEINRLAAP
jgi:hypothetical protein